MYTHSTVSVLFAQQTNCKRQKGGTRREKQLDSSEADSDDKNGTLVNDSKHSLTQKDEWASINSFMLMYHSKWVNLQARQGEDLCSEVKY